MTRMSLKIRIRIVRGMRIKRDDKENEKTL